MAQGSEKSEQQGGIAREVCRAADALSDSGDLRAAKELLKDFLSEHDHPSAWKKYAHVLLGLNELAEAGAAMRHAVLKKGDNSHIVDLILAGVPRVRPLIDHKHKIMYFHVPKCGSTSMKAAFLYLQQGELKGVASHRRTWDLLTAVELADLTTTYADYFKIAVIRHPIARLRSFYRRNILQVETLKKGADKQAQWDGLSTMPAYGEVLDRFARYHAVFRAFRYHASPLPGFLGSDPEAFDLLEDISRLDSVLDKLSELTGQSIPRIEQMTSDSSTIDWSEFVEKEQALVENFYANEMAIYGKYFRTDPFTKNRFAKQAAAQ